MGCYLVCHFSGLWASLMSTLIPLRSGAGVYATLEKKKKEKRISFSARDLWAVVSSAEATSGPQGSRLHLQTLSDRREFTASLPTSWKGEFSVESTTANDKSKGTWGGTLIVKHFQSTWKIPLDYHFTMLMSVPDGFLNFIFSITCVLD